MPNFLTAHWNNLIMANYKVDPALLRDHLPAQTELDLYNGDCYVSLVGFMFEETAVRGIKFPFHVNFEEVNLRFYVRYNDHGIWKRGAVFIKEIVTKRMISFVANTLYKENYITLPMKHHYIVKDSEIDCGYHWKYAGNWMRLEVVAEKDPVAIVPGSKEEFIAEHYWGYSRYNKLTTFEYGVAHESWLIHAVKHCHIECDFAKLYGTVFAVLDNARPNSVFLAKGSAISVSGKRKLRVVDLH